MSMICTILLVIAAGAIGRLWPRKTKTEVVEKIVEKEIGKEMFGLFVPPECTEINFTNLSYYFAHTNSGYNSITLKPSKDKNIKLTFRFDRDHLAGRDLEGVVR